MSLYQEISNWLSGTYRVRVETQQDGSQVQRVSNVAAGLAVRIVDASATLQYVGEAEPGSATSAAVWRIRTIDTSSGTVILWADGTADFTKIWDNYNGYSFS